MRLIHKTLFLISLFIVVACQSSTLRTIASDHSISASTHQLVTWETKANAVSNRSDELIQVEHYEIPMRLLQKDFLMAT